MHRVLPSSQRGVTLIEVLVTVVILSVGLLGVAAMQAFSLQSGQAAFQRTQATTIAYEISDQLRANRSRVLNGGTLPGLDVWQNWASQMLPEGDVAVTNPDANGQVTITVSWTDQRGRDALADSETVVLTTRI